MKKIKKCIKMIIFEICQIVKKYQKEKLEICICDTVYVFGRCY